MYSHLEKKINKSRGEHIFSSFKCRLTLSDLALYQQELSVAGMNLSLHPKPQYPNMQFDIVHVSTFESFP